MLAATVPVPLFPFGGTDPAPFAQTPRSSKLVFLRHMRPF
jgi:hypothetical protein